MSQIQEYPFLDRFVERVSSLDPFQKKSIAKQLAAADRRFFQFADSVIRRIHLAVDREDDFEYLAETYLWYTKLLRIEEMYYAKNGTYRYSDYQEVYEKVYSRSDYMHDYVVGLGLSQPFWTNHYKVFRFFLDDFLPLVSEAELGAETGVGHGLFHSELMLAAPKVKTKLLDISSAAIDFTKKTIAASGIDVDRTEPYLGDVQKDIPIEDSSLDVLLMGEFIEHIAECHKVMREMSSKMKYGGKCYFSTAANAPAEDHIIVFKTSDEIRDFITTNNWKILKEQVFPIGNLSEREANERAQTMNYCAVLSRA